jgi:ABC-type polysaccharide/polyol phosphate export permease
MTTHTLPQLRRRKAIQDIITGITSWRLWMMLGWQDIKLRYRRSSLGPFWITASMAVTIYSLGILYSHLWKIAHADYMLYFACGLLVWTLMVTVVNESANIFLESRGYLLQIQIPITVFIMRLLFRNCIIFFHNILAVIPILIFYHSLINWRTLLVFPMFFILLMSLFSFSMLLSILGLRFRDIGQLVISLMSLMFFLTPIMWVPSNLPEKYQFVVKYNPFAQLVDLIRAPLMGQLPSLYSLGYVLVMFILGMLFMVYCLSKFRHRIVFWL